MATVTITGSAGEVINLQYDNNGSVTTSSNENTAKAIAYAISTANSSGTLVVTETGGGAPLPNVPTGQTGLLLQNQSGTNLVSRGYDNVIVSDGVQSAMLIGNSSANQRILAGTANLNFVGSAAPTGSGTIAGGGGNNVVTLPSTDSGNWVVSFGDGNNQVRALGAGSDTINTGKGQNTIQVGTGSGLINTAGNDTITAAGSDTIYAMGNDVVHGGPTLVFAGGQGSTVYGGGGSDTLMGGQGPDLFYAGSGGNSSITAGVGNATLFGGGDGDQLFANGGQAQILYGGPGSETLSGSGASGSDTFAAGPGNTLVIGGGGTNTYVASLGNATIHGALGAGNVFAFTRGMAGGTELVKDLTSADQVQLLLSGYGSTYQPVQTLTASGLTVTLSDNTQVMFSDIHSGTITNITRT